MFYRLSEVEVCFLMYRGCSDGKTAMHLAVQGVTTGEHLHIVRSLSTSQLESRRCA